MEPNIICHKCSNIPLLGFNFDHENKNLSDSCELYSYCIFEHENKKKKLHKYHLDDIFDDDNGKNKKCNFRVFCEVCKEKEIEYHCFDCQRNICKDCFEDHMGHKYYYNKDYISEEDLKEINNKFKESQDNVKKNLDIIYNRIKKFEEQLKYLKKLYEQFKNINDKLLSFTNYIFNMYNKLSKSKKGIYYSIYFNLKNILLFNPKKINIPEDDCSIESFMNILNEKIVSGYYFLIKNSNKSQNLDEYNKFPNKQINYDMIDLNEFNEVYADYKKMIPYTKKKCFGIRSKKIEIYNIRAQTIEASLNFANIKNIFYNKEYNVLIFLSEQILYILNPNDFSIKQQITVNLNKQKEKEEEKDKNKDESSSSSLWDEHGYKKKSKLSNEEEEDIGEFIYVEILSEKSFAVVYKGDITYLGEKHEKILGGYDSNLINIEIDYEDEECKDFSYLIIYEEKKEKFIPKKIILLVKNIINTNEVSKVTGKYVEVEEVEPYCTFEFNSMIKLSKDELIISYKTEVKQGRDQYYFYITDTNYKDEIVYYYLNIKDENMIHNKIYSAPNTSYLIKNEKENILYFLCEKIENIEDEFNKYIEDSNFKFKEIKFDDEYQLSGEINNVFISRNTIIFTNEKNIYLWKIIGDKVENIDEIQAKKIIRFVSLKDKKIYI